MAPLGLGDAEGALVAGLVGGGDPLEVVDGVVRGDRRVREEEGVPGVGPHAGGVEGESRIELGAFLDNHPRIRWDPAHAGQKFCWQPTLPNKPS